MAEAQSGARSADGRSDCTTDASEPRPMRETDEAAADRRGRPRDLVRRRSGGATTTSRCGASPRCRPSRPSTPPSDGHRARPRAARERRATTTMRLRDLAQRAALVGDRRRGRGRAAADVSARSADRLCRGRRAGRRGDRHAARRISPRGGARRRAERHRRSGAAAGASCNELTNVGVALSTERDLHTLLEMILSQARRITTSDAGSLYLDRARRARRAGRRCCARSSRRTSRCPALPFTEFAVPIDHTSLAGYAAATGEPLVIADVYLLPDDVDLQAEPQLRREVRLSHEVDARDPDEDASRRDHRRAAADQSQARRGRAAHRRPRSSSAR